MDEARESPPGPDPAPSETEGGGRDEAESPPGQAEPGVRWHFAAIYAVHLALVLYYAPPKHIFAKNPIVVFDYVLHAYQIDRALVAFRQAGELWSYDPMVLAGQPAGLVEDLTSKGTELFVIGLSGLGVHPAIAFNVFILLAHLMVPLVAWQSARWFGLSRREALWTMGLWSGLWFFDSLLHWAWFIGMVSWSIVQQLAVLLIALVYRIFRTDDLRLYGALVPLAAVIAIVHPFGVLTVLPACVLLYWRRFRSLRAAHHGLLLLGVVLAGSTTLVWIEPTVALRHYIGDADTWFRPTLEYLPLDTLDLLHDARNTGSPVRTFVRTVCFVAGGIVLWRWRKARDDRFAPLAIFIGVAIAMAYLAAYSWTGRQTQPYRQIGPAMLAAALPAAVLLADVLRRSELRKLSRPAKILLALALVAVVPRAARTVLHFVPHLIPSQVEHELLDRRYSAVTGIQEPHPVYMGHVGPPEDWQALRAWVLEHAHDRGRFLVSEWTLGEYLAASTPAAILGGLPERNVPHVDANPFRRRNPPNLEGDGLRRFVERYGVGYVVLSREYGPLDLRRDVLEPLEVVDRFRIYRTKIEPSYFARGAGRVQAQAINTIQVVDARGEPDVVLRFHWMEPLRCRPLGGGAPCQVERFPVEEDRVGFIRVPNPPPRFEIYNSYEL